MEKPITKTGQPEPALGKKSASNGMSPERNPKNIDGTGENQIVANGSPSPSAAQSVSITESIRQAAMTLL